MLTKKWRVAIFDWNGTLCNDFPLVYRVVEAIFAAYNLRPPTPAEYRNEVEADFIKLYHNHGIPQHVTAQYLNNKFRKKILEEYWNGIRLQRNTKFVLSNCKKLGLKCAIISGEMSQILKKRLDDFGIAKYFDYVAADAYLKPKTELMKMAINEIGVKPKETFYVDDSCDGIKSAKEVGIATIGFTGGYYSKRRIISVKPDFAIDNLREIIEIIKQGQ